MDQEKKSEVQSNGVSGNISKAADYIINRVASTPVGQYGLRQIDGLLLLFEETLDWSTSTKNNNHNGKVNSHKTPVENGCLDLQNTWNHSRGSTSWKSFIPIYIISLFVRFYVNFMRMGLGKKPVNQKEAKGYVESSRRYFKNVRFSGSKIIRNHQKMTARRLRKRSQEMNIVCRTFSKWPLKLFVKRLRKVLNFLGVITLPLPSDLKRNSVNGREGSVPSQKEKINTQREIDSHGETEPEVQHEQVPKAPRIFQLKMPYQDAPTIPEESCPTVNQELSHEELHDSTLTSQELEEGTNQSNSMDGNNFITDQVEADQGRAENSDEIKGENN